MCFRLQAAFPCRPSGWEPDRVAARVARLLGTLPAVLSDAGDVLIDPAAVCTMM